MRASYFTISSTLGENDHFPQPKAATVSFGGEELAQRRLLSFPDPKRKPASALGCDLSFEQSS